MFTQVEPLTKDAHQDLRFTPAGDYGFAAKSNTSPLTFSEFAVASKHFPIVFLKETGVPVAILSLENEKNGFLSAEGQWTVPYVPAHFRRYPFVLANIAPQPTAGDDAPHEGETEIRRAFCIDRAAPQFNEPQGELLFTANGEFTDFVHKQVEFLKQFQQELDITAALSKHLQEQNVLVERSFQAVVNGQPQPVGGFSVVDVNLVNQLEDAVLADWVRRGIMGLITSHLNSLIGIPMGEGA